MHIVAGIDLATFALKRNAYDDFRRNPVIEIYCSENGITIKQRLHELNISESNFYYARRALTARQSTSGGSFIQLGNASGLTFPEPARSASGSRKRKNVPVESYMTLELRTESGSAMRIQGNFTSEHLGIIMSSLR